MTAPYVRNIICIRVPSAYVSLRIPPWKILATLMSALHEVSVHRGPGTRWWRQILDRKWKYGRFARVPWKIRNITLIYGQIAKIPAS